MHRAEHSNVEDQDLETLRGSTIPLNVHSEYGHLDEIMKVLEDYSTRQLRYDSDALNAVAGVLNHLRTRRAFDSTWGTPFSSIPNEGWCRLCIHWKHQTPATRRPGFPSWSPLGWRDGQVLFNCESFQYRLRKPGSSNIEANSDTLAHQKRS